MNNENSNCENDVENADLHGKEQASSYRLNLKETNGRHQYEKISSASSCLTGGNALYKCSICGQEPFWNGKPLTLTLDHINGKNHDNELSNLRWVCPNCDRQLDTFGYKNVKNLI